MYFVLQNEINLDTPFETYNQLGPSPGGRKSYPKKFTFLPLDT
jgi:hypothetical protein